MLHDVLAFMSTHAAWAGPVMFLVAFGESFAFVSFLFPGTAIMLAAGAFIPGGTLSAWPLVIGAISGAVLGDAISFELGHRYGHHLDKVWPFKRRPDLLARGCAFSEQHGGKAVFAGRFFGPFRAVVPLGAGITKLKRDRFWIANVTSALVWAPALLLPGALAAWFADNFHLDLTGKIVLFAAIAAIVVAAIWLARRFRLLDRVLP